MIELINPISHIKAVCRAKRAVKPSLRPLSYPENYFMHQSPLSEENAFKKFTFAQKTAMYINRLLSSIK